MTSNELIEFGMLAVTSVIAVFAFFAVLAAWKSARETAKSAEAQLILPFLEEYASSDMLDALTLLKRFKSKHGKNFEYEFSDIFKRSVDGGFPENDARRKVNYYFEKAYRLHKQGLLSKESLCLITDVDGYAMLDEIVAPLSRGISQDRTERSGPDWFDELQELCPPPTFDEPSTSGSR